MNNYNKTQWIKNETLVSADNLNKIENQLDSLTINVTENLNSLNSLNNQLDEHLTNINNLQSDIDSLSNDIIDVNNNIASINNNINTVNEDIINLETSLSSDIDTINSNIIDINDNISAINESFNSQIEDINNEINDLKEFNNTIIGTASDIDAISIKDSIPSGFIELGELDYDYMLNHENEVKLKSNSIAYINGYRIEIPKDTIINIDKAPEKNSREDLIFLEAYKDENYPKAGNLSWRIRYVTNVDFNTYYMDGFSAGTNGRNPRVTARGAAETEYIALGVDDKGSFNRGDLLGFKDQGLFVTSSNKELFNTLDGYVYAIPMFRLYRKPSCGKAIPFEYSKFNPKCDYNKFRELMKEDKVERVVSENIKGRSLVNLIRYSNLNVGLDGLNKDTFLINYNSYYVDLYQTGIDIFKNNITYTCIWDYEILEGGNITPYMSIGYTDGENSGFVQAFRDSASKVFTFTPTLLGEDHKGINLRPCRDDVGNVSRKFKCRIMILEGDYTNKNIPEFFTGLKSLGEDDNNLIAIKNGILDKDTYDINDGNQKLNTFEDITYISSDNTIKPIVEAVIKNGEEEIPLESLNTKIETTGEEIIEFTKIKGKTYHNLITEVINDTTQYRPICKSTLIKPDTDYTIILINTSSNNYNLYTNEFIFNDSKYLSLGKGEHKILTRSLSTIEDTGIVLKNYPGNTEFSLKNIMLLEGDWTNKEIPSYIEGIKSVGEYRKNKISLRSNNRNLISKDMYTNTWFHSLQGDYELDLNDKTGKKYSIYNIKTFGLTDLKLTCNKEFNRLLYRGKDIHNNILYKGDLGAVKLTEYIFSDIPENIVTLDLYINSFGIDDSYDFMLKEIDDNDNYIEHKSSIQNIYLKEPLRSLPNGTCDEIIGNKIIRRIEKLILDSNRPWVLVTDSNKPDNDEYARFSFPLSNAKISGLVISDNFSYSSGYSESIDKIYITSTPSLSITIKLSRLKTPDLNGFKQWLIDNPTTVYYELANPIEEYIEQIYDKESIKTYQLDAPLRSLPNGIKDEIKDGILTRRLGEIILDGSDDEEWNPKNQDNVSTMHFQTGNLIKSKIVTSIEGLLASNFKVGPAWENTILDEGITIGRANQTGFDIRIKRSRLSSENVTGFKEWLKDNPIKVIYELTNPIEIPLVETSCQSVDYSLNRQFKEGNYLKELPNGTKDTIENGKVIRRLDEIVLDNKTTYEWGNDNSKQYVYIKNFTSKIKANSRLICNKLPYYNGIKDRQINYITISSNKVIVFVFSTATFNTLEEGIAEAKRLIGDDGLKIIYELETPIEEELTVENCNYYPYHDFNTYCGNMYLGNGRNYIINDNKLSTEDSIIVESDFREIKNNLNIEDCRYKKSEEGYDNMYLKSIGNNLVLLKNLRHISLTESSGNLWTQKGTINYDYDGNIKWYNQDDYDWSDMGVILNVKGNTKYTFGINMIDNKESSYNLVVSEFSKKPIIDVGEANVSNYLGIKKLGSTSSTGIKTFTFITNKDTKYIYCSLSIQKRNESYTLKDFIVNEGTSIDFELGKSTSIAFENIEENDVDDLRHLTSLVGFNYSEILEKNFNLLLQGEL